MTSGSPYLKKTRNLVSSIEENDLLSVKILVLFIFFLHFFPSYRNQNNQTKCIFTFCLMLNEQTKKTKLNKLNKLCVCARDPNAIKIET